MRSVVELQTLLRNNGVISQHLHIRLTSLFINILKIKIIKEYLIRSPLLTIKAFDLKLITMHEFLSVPLF